MIFIQIDFSMNNKNDSFLLALKWVISNNEILKKKKSVHVRHFFYHREAKMLSFIFLKKKNYDVHLRKRYFCPPGGTAGGQLCCVLQLAIY